MFNSLNSSVTEGVFEGIIPNYVQNLIDIYLKEVALISVGIFGVITNIINLIVLFKQGLKDCVSICLISLALSDFDVSFLTAAYGLSAAVARSGKYYYIDPFGFTYLIPWTISITCDITMLTTTFVSVERCLCVLLPFKFKNIITAKRAAIVVAAIYVYCISIYSSSFATRGFSKQWDPNENQTRIMLWFSSDRDKVDKFIHVAQTSVCTILCQVVVLASTHGMLLGLRKSVQFQTQKSSMATVDARSSADATSKKNTAVVKMVTILAIIFIICNFMRMCVSPARQIVPEISYGKRYNNLYQTIIALYILAGAVNSSVNIFVYYHFKPKFKSVLCGLFCINKDEE